MYETSHRIQEQIYPSFFLKKYAMTLAIVHVAQNTLQNEAHFSLLPNISALLQSSAGSSEFLI